MMKQFAKYVWLALLIVSAACAAYADDWKLVYEQNFDQPGWGREWQVEGKAGPTNQGALISGQSQFTAKLNRTFEAPAIRVEFDATKIEADRDGDVGDLSMQLDWQFFRFGCEANSLTVLEGTGWYFPAPEMPRIEVGRTYHIVAEINGRDCRFVIDGKLVGEMVLDEPMKRMQPQFFSWCGVSRYDNVRIFTKAQPDPIAPELLDRVRQREAEVQTPIRAPGMNCGTLRTYAAIHSLGFEWDLVGDGNHNATCAVRYRAAGTAEWKSALPLLRIDFRGRYGKAYAYRHFNMFAGSILFLEPGTSYEVELTATDPDGGKANYTVKIATHAVPSLQPATRTFHVVPAKSAAGAGTGSAADPFRGIEEALAGARPGDAFLLHAGTYPGFVLDKSGAEGKYIALKAAGDGEAIFTSRIGLAASHVWFEGLTFDQGSTGKGIRAIAQGLEDVVISRNTFRNCRYAVSTIFADWTRDDDAAYRHWYVADNVMTGGEGTEYGLRVYKFVDSDICYNRIDGTGNGGDAISVRMCRSIDIYGNDAYKADDDCLEPDGSYANIRMWENRMSGHYEAVSFQPMTCSPWYVIRNEFSTVSDTLKDNVADRFVFVNNTIVIRSRATQDRAYLLLGSLSRNNLWVLLARNSQRALMWNAYSAERQGPWGIAYSPLPNWRTDVDYDGFDWGELTTPFQWVLPNVKTERYDDIASFSKAVGIEQHAIRVKKEEIFDVPSVADYWSAQFPTQQLTLKAGCNAIDAGAPLPNICETFSGKAPDLGAHEFGAPAAWYGPRPQR